MVNARNKAIVVVVVLFFDKRIFSFPSLFLRDCYFEGVFYLRLYIDCKESWGLDLNVLRTFSESEARGKRIFDAVEEFNSKFQIYEMEISMRKRIQPHIMCGMGDVAKYVLIPGDPRRVETIASFLDKSRKVADYRGFITYTGSSDGTGISVCSTGIGCPSAAIAVEELARIGAETFIRVGTTGALQKNINVGDIVIATAAVRADGTSRNYAPIELPAVADFNVAAALLQAAKESKRKIYFGLVLSSDAFYCKHENLKQWSKLNVLSVEMETSVIFTIATLRKLRAGSILVWMATHY